MTLIITAIRNERSKANKAPKEPINISILAKDENTNKMISSTTKYLVKFTNPKKLEFLTEPLQAKGNVVVVLPMATIYIPSSDLVDIEEVIKKLETEKKRLEGELLRSEKMLSNPSFTSKAPKAKIDAEIAKQTQYKALYDEVCKNLSDLKA